MNSFTTQLLILLCLFAYAHSFTVHAAQPPGRQESDTPTLESIVWNDVSGVVENLGDFAAYPLHMGTDDVILAGIVLTGIAFTTCYDADAYNMLTGEADVLLDIADAYGYIGFGQALTAGIYVSGLLAGDDDLRLCGTMLCESLLFSGLITSGMKFVIGRSRPYTSSDPFHFDSFSMHEDNLSFPSGHTTAAFAISTILAKHCDNPAGSLFLHSMASLTGVSRLVRGKHWLSDVLLGAVIGYSTGIFVYNAHKPNKKQGYDKVHSSAYKLNIMPSLNGISLVVSF